MTFNDILDQIDMQYIETIVNSQKLIHLVVCIFSLSLFFFSLRHIYYA